MKKKGIYVALFFILSFWAYSSELRVFKDKAIYFPDKPKSFIGFNKAEVYCDGEQVRVYKVYKAKGNSELEKKYNEYLALKEKESYLKKKLSIFDSVVKSANLKTAGDISSFLKNLSVYTKNYVKDEANLSEVTFKLQSLKSYLSSVIHDFNPYYADLPSNCKDIKIVFKGITYSLDNTLIINSKTARVLKELKIANKSGIDIFADRIFLMNFVSKKYFVPIQFKPWEIEEGVIYEAVNRKVSRVVLPPPAMRQMKAGEPSAPDARQVESRVYLINNLSLPCDGTEKKIKLKEKQIEINHFLVVYPYRDLSVYNEYSFKLPFEVDSNRWRVVVNNKVFDKCFGKLDSKKKLYRIFAGEDFSVTVKRDKIVSFEEKAGFLRGKIVKKDGYEINLSNMSDKNKKIKVIDRIPISKKEGITVKNVKISGAPYVLDKEGKIVFNVSLKPGEFKKLRVVFEIEYPEEQSIYY